MNFLVILKEKTPVCQYIANAEEGDLKERKDLSVCQKINQYEEQMEKKTRLGVKEYAIMPVHHFSQRSTKGMLLTGD